LPPPNPDLSGFGTKTIRIAHLTPTFTRSNGIDRVVELLAREQTAQGNEVSIFVLEADMKPPDKVELQVIGMPKGLLGQRVYRLILPVDIFKAVRWVPRLKGFDIIYAHQYPMTWLAFLARKFYGVRYIYYDHGLAQTEIFPTILERFYWRMFCMASLYTAKGASGAIAISLYLQEQLKKDTGLTGEVVYDQIDMQRLRIEGNGSLIRQKYQIGDSPLILYVGRISPSKGIHLLISAFISVKQRISNAKLLIVGRHTFPGYTAKLNSLSDSSVIFAGDISDEELSYCYAACDIYATATLWEGFNLPLVEAQACGKPVVAFNLGPHPEVVRDGITGFLVPPEDTGAMAEAIGRLLGDVHLRQEMGAEAQKWAKEKFCSTSAVGPN
jgi:1,2-diacylglycerol 3-alpha-glucosyltransferase